CVLYFNGGARVF
nr:immunoglobulin light chain junction region [Macaca mulatta]